MATYGDIVKIFTRLHIFRQLEVQLKKFKCEVVFPTKKVTGSICLSPSKVELGVPKIGIFKLLPIMH